MLSITDCKFLSSAEREGKNGKYYQVTILCEDEPIQLLSNKDVYEISKNLEFGAERRALLDIRKYGKDWGLRLVDLLTYEE